MKPRIPLQAAYLLLPAIVLLWAAVPPASAQGFFVASLDGYEEVPAISSSGTGSAVVRIPDETQISYKLNFGNLTGATVMVAHIHFGRQATNGGVVAFLCGGGGKPACPVSGTIEGTIAAADVQALPAQGIAAGELDKLIDAIRAGSTYFNLHTDKFPSGEIRGQIRPRISPPSAN